MLTSFVDSALRPRGAYGISFFMWSQASPPIPSVCSVQEAARITVEMINAHGGVGDGLGFGAAAAATAAPLTLGSIVAAAATGLRAAGAPAIGVSPEAPVEPTINLVFNEPAPGSTSESVLVVYVATVRKRS